MLFRQKEKVADVGRDNFREFLRRENDSCAVTQMKLSAFSQKPAKKESQYSTVMDGSMKMLGSTWDAQHLGTFLQKSQFATSGTRALKLTEPFNSSLKNQSFFFRNQQPRLQDNIDYLHMNNINHMIAEHPTANAQDFIQTKMLQVPPKQFDDTKIAVNNEKTLQKPSQQLQQLKETKEQQIKYAEWRKEFGDVNRAFKKAKRAYKSGLLGLDHPLVESTQLYKEEHEAYLANQEWKNKQKVYRLKSLEKFQNSNPAIEFNNLKHIDNVTNQNDSLLHERNFPIKNYEIDNDWMRKKPSQQNFETKARIFGASEQQSSKVSLRAQNLKDQELRGRDYNAISLTKIT